MAKSSLRINRVVVAEVLDKTDNALIDNRGSSEIRFSIAIFAFFRKTVLVFDFFDFGKTEPVSLNLFTINNIFCLLGVFFPLNFVFQARFTKVKFFFSLYFST